MLELVGYAADEKTNKAALRKIEDTIEEGRETAKELNRLIPEPKGRLLYA